MNWTKSARVLAWRPAFTFFEALSATARWYKEAAHVPSSEGCMRDFNGTLMTEHHRAAVNLGVEWALDEGVGAAAGQPRA